MALIFALGWLAWPVVGSLCANAFQATASVVLGAVDFGKGGHAEFLPARKRELRSADQDDSWDASVQLRIDGVAQAHAITINPRRLIYLPLLFFTGFVAVSPLSLRRKGVCLLFGSLALLISALGSAWVIVAWIFARVPGLVYDLADWQMTALGMLYEGFVTPIANKFIVPLLLAFALASWQLAREASTAQQVSAEAQPREERSSRRPGRDKASARKKSRRRR